MGDSVTLTVRLPARTKEQLAELASRTRRTRSFLAAEAVAEYVARELAITERIERGRADARAGRTMPHEEVMKEARAIIRSAAAKR
jgi:predicted transcriptional regulator